MAYFNTILYHLVIRTEENDTFHSGWSKECLMISRRSRSANLREVWCVAKMNTWHFSHTKLPIRPITRLSLLAVLCENFWCAKLCVLCAVGNWWVQNTVWPFAYRYANPLWKENKFINPLNAELNPICYLLALLAHHFLHVSRIRVKSLTIRLLMSYIYIWSAYSWCF